MAKRLSPDGQEAVNGRLAGALGHPLVLGLQRHGSRCRMITHILHRREKAQVVCVFFVVVVYLF